MANTTEAWVLHRASGVEADAAGLQLEIVELREPGAEDVVVEPIHGCWEGNMTHAVLRDPVDVCVMRGEDPIVLGNAGSVRVVAVGSAVRGVAEGSVWMINASGSADRHGFMIRAYAYDEPHTMGVLARRLVIRPENLLPIPEGSQFSAREWAAFSLRFPTAWANWRLALGAFRLQMTERDCPEPFVVAWGGGVGLAQLLLARRAGCRVAMISGRPERLAEIRRLGIEPVDRRAFADLDHDESRYATDPGYRAAYRRAEESFLDALRTAGGGREVSIFLDHVGAPVLRATLKALGRQGVLATAGWRRGMHSTTIRAIECMTHHLHVHTHGAKLTEAFEATAYAEETGWMAPVERDSWCWERIDELASASIDDRVGAYFPIFDVHADAAAVSRAA